MLEIAKKQFNKENEEILNRLEIQIEFYLLKSDITEDDINIVFNQFNELIDPKNEEHVKRLNKLKNLIDIIFPKQ